MSEPHEFPPLDGIHDVIDRIHDCLDAEEGVLIAERNLTMEQAWSAVQGCLAAVVADRFLELPVERERVMGAVEAFTRHLRTFTAEQWDRDHPK